MKNKEDRGPAHGAGRDQVGHVTRAEASKSLVHLQAEAMAEKRFTEMMASAGVGYNQMAKELLFFLPRSFLDAYEQLWYRGLAGKDDGGSGARGSATAEQARVGKASGKGLQGLGGAKRKTYKRYWVIADEHALEVKDRMDKRLRGMAREIKDMLAGVDRADSEQARCAECGRILQAGWKFCPNDGTDRSIIEK